MAWPEVSIEDLPPRRDDEPASLRQDILDELTDHFSCALNRELLKNPDEQLARQRVLNQFGDPIKIARQLWFDAMKEKMMSQKIMTGVSVVMAVCCIAVVGIAWMLMKESQSVNQKMLTQLAVFADRPLQIEVANLDQKMLKQLEPLNQISFRLVQKKKDGKPAVGFTGKLTKGGKQVDTFTVDAISDQSGKLDFGKLPWGKYDLNLSAPWGESYHHSDMTVLPGRDFPSQTIVCPASAPEEVAVQFQVDWSDKLKPEDWYLVCDFRNLFVEDGLGEFRLESTRSFQDDQWLNVQNQFKNPRGVYLINKKNQAISCSITQVGRVEDLKLDDLVEKPSIKMLEGKYSLPVMYLIQKAHLNQISDHLNNVDYVNVLNHKRTALVNFDHYSKHENLGYKIIDTLTTTLLFPFAKKTPNSDGLMGLDSSTKMASGIQYPHRLKFSASKDQENVWEIRLPELGKLKIPDGVKGFEGIGGAGQGFF